MPDLKDVPVIDDGVATAEMPELVVEKVGAFAALRYPNYRLVWFGMFGSSGAVWMEQLAFGWLVLDLTGSSLNLGITGLFRAMPMVLFSIWGGVLADRVNRRTMMLVSQCVSIVTILMLATLGSLHLLQVWMVYIFAFTVGTAQSFNVTSRQSIVGDVVPLQILPNAIALNSLAFNVSRVLGPSFGGLLVAWLGTIGVFWFETVLLAFLIFSTYKLQLPERIRTTDEQRSPLDDLREAIRYVSGDSYIKGLMLIAAVPVLFILPYQQMLPVFARENLQIGADGLGILMSAAGIGAVIMLLILVTLGDHPVRGILQTVCVIAMPIVLILMVNSTSFPLVLFLMAVMTACSITYNVINQTLVQTHTPPEVRGRVLGIYMLIMGTMPIGGLAIGALTDIVGLPRTLTAFSLIALVLIIQVLIRFRRIQNAH